MSKIILLGPQGRKPNLPAALEECQVDGPIVSITAGWRDGEGDVAELAAVAGCDVVDLQLYHRADRIFTECPDLHALHRARQDRLKALQRLYQVRLKATVQAARELLAMEADPELLMHEQRAAINQIRALDRHHVQRVAKIHQRFERDRATLDLPPAIAEREEVHDLLRRSAAVLISGGHVAVLLNRIRLFSMAPLLAEKAIIGWSAGAMVLASRVVLFHDDAPQGRRDAEILDVGLGLAPGLVVLPHARSRLDWHRRTRMALLARRFAPAACIAMDAGSRVSLADGVVSDVEAVRRIARTGRPAAVRVP